MTQRHISHPEPLPACAAGHGARHIHDLRNIAAGGGHFVECKCRMTSKHADPEAALSEWRRINRPARSARKVCPRSPRPGQTTLCSWTLAWRRQLRPGEQEQEVAMGAA